MNGVQSGMTNGVKLELAPSFVYINGVSYLQLTHKLTNTSGKTVTGQKFGAAADIMIHTNDRAPLAINSDGVIDQTPKTKLLQA
ncbi:MAG: hypothetical protein LBT14_05025 [Treponema sp.]|nr:hypothetical protein [Treponema sp.]